MAYGEGCVTRNFCNCSAKAAKLGPKMSENQEQLLLCWDCNLSVGDAHSGATAAEGKAAPILADVVEVVVQFLLY